MASIEIPRTVAYGGIIIIYLLSIAVYRRYFHPLAAIPGPFLASTTKLYQTYFSKRYFKHIGRLHEIYGPVIRICPNEVHLSDPAMYDKIYYVGTDYGKDPIYYDATNVPLSTFGATNVESHRIRRAAMNPMFSRKMVLQLEDLVQEKAIKLCNVVQETVSQGTPCDLHHGFRAVSVDVISSFAFDKSLNLLDDERLGEQWQAQITAVGPAIWLFQLIPGLRELSLALPRWFTDRTSEPLRAIFQLRDAFARQIENVRERHNAGSEDRQTIFSTLLFPEEKPDGYVPLSTEDLTDEAFSLMFAASDTTGNAMTVAAFNVIRHAEIYAKLTAELGDHFPDASQALSFTELEGLPYLTAVIKEALRLSFGVPGRLPRVVPEPGAVFNGLFVPAGTIVGMSSWIMHRSAEAFPDPMCFNPDRWLDSIQVRKLEHHMIPFSRGSRQCVGMPLAYAELYITLGTFFRRFHNLKVYKTTEWDMEYIDAISAYHVRGRNWLKVVSKETAVAT